MDYSEGDIIQYGEKLYFVIDFYEYRKKTDKCVFWVHDMYEVDSSNYKGPTLLYNDKRYAINYSKRNRLKLSISDIRDIERVGKSDYSFLKWYKNSAKLANIMASEDSRIYVKIGFLMSLIFGILGSTVFHISMQIILKMMCVMPVVIYFLSFIMSAYDIIKDGDIYLENIVSGTIDSKRMEKIMKKYKKLDYNNADCPKEISKFVDNGGNLAHEPTVFTPINPVDHSLDSNNKSNDNLEQVKKRIPDDNQK